MNCYKLKINGKYVKSFKETEKQGAFAGNWHNHTARMVTVPVFGDESEALIIEGRINLKSYLDKIALMIKDKVEINSFEVLKIK